MTPKEAFKEIKCQYAHDECKQFPDDDMQISVRFDEECMIVEQALTELELKTELIKEFMEIFKENSICVWSPLMDEIEKVGK